MKKTIILFILIAFTSFSGWTQKIAYNGTPVFTGAEGTSILIPYKYTSTVTCKIEVSISRYNGVGGFDYVSFVGSAITTNKAAGTDLTGTLNFNIPNGTLPTNLLDSGHLYRIKMELKNNSTNAWITGVYDDVFTITGDGINYAPPVITTAETGTTATINYKYNSSTTASIYSKIERQYGWTAQTPIIADKFVPSLAAGSGLTGFYTLAIPAGATPSEFLNSDLLENYKLILELTNSTGYQGGLYTPFEITQGIAIPTAVSITSIPLSTEVGTNLVVNYKYTSPSAGGKVAINISKNGGTNASDFISNVIYAETPTVAGTNVTGTFTLAIPSDTTPKKDLTGNQNYRIKIELYDAASNFLAGNYDNINYNFTTSLGVNDFDYNKLSAYPNPVDTVLKIDNNKELSNPSFRIFNISGQTVQKSKTLNDGGIDVSSLKPGVYMLSVDSDKKSKQIKFIKK